MVYRGVTPGPADGKSSFPDLPEVVDDTLTVAVTGLPDEAASGTLSLTGSRVDDHGDTRPMEAEETFTASALRQGA